jgi:hypothetical protein
MLRGACCLDEMSRSMEIDSSAGSARKYPNQRFLVPGLPTGPKTSRRWDEPGTPNGRPAACSTVHLFSDIHRDAQLGPGRSGSSTSRRLTKALYQSAPFDTARRNGYTVYRERGTG